MKCAEIANITKEIFQSRRIADMRSFDVAMKIARITECLQCMMILATIMKKKSESEENP